MKKISLALIIFLIATLIPIFEFHSTTPVQAAPTINIGTYIQFGSYNSAPILWRVIHKDANGDPVLFADRILTFKAFDAKGSYHTGNTDRLSNGSNYYPDSNIRQWLNSSSPNSDANTIDWIQNDPSAVNMFDGHNPYNTEKGFLANGNFTSTERGLIKPLTHKVLLAGVDQAKKDGGTQNHFGNPSLGYAVQNYDTTAYFKNVMDNVFLLSVKQLKEWVYDNRNILGSDYHLAKPTSQAMTQSTIKDPNLDINYNSNYWLNSPYASYSNYVRFVYTNGNIGYGGSANSGGYGIRPALFLNLSSAIFATGGIGTSCSPYVVIGGTSGTADTQAPSAPSGLGASSISATTLTLAWTASTDNVGVTAYEVYKGAKLIDTVTGSGGVAPLTTFNFTGLTAGTTYSFNVRARDAAGNISAASTALTVMTTSSLSNAPIVHIGDYIQFGSYNSVPILWRVIHKDANGDPVLFADRILTLKAFDAKGSYHTGNTDRVSYGSNYYPDSNIRQWLNSSSPNSGANTIDWIQNDPSAANMYSGQNPYNTEKGFLAEGNFTSIERSLIKPLTHKVLLAGVDQAKKDGGTQNHLSENSLEHAVQNYDTTAYFKNVMDNVFLLSVKQLKEWVYDNRNILGSDYHLAKPTSQAVAQSTYKDSTYLNSNNYWYYWLNSPSAEYSYFVKHVTSDGYLPGTNPNGEIVGVRPALLFEFSSSSIISGGAGTSCNPYVVLGADTQVPSAPSGLGANSVSQATLTLAWNASTDNVGVTAYEVFRGTTLIGKVTGSGGAAPLTTFNVTGLTANTTYSFTVRAKDAAGNTSVASTALSVTTPALESQAPTAPAELTASNTTKNGTTLTWTAATDNVGVTAYEVYRGTTKIATLTGTGGTLPPTTYSVTGLTAGTTYSFTVKARDANGNVSAASNAVSVTTESSQSPNAPTNITLSGNKVIEFNWVGYEIGTFSATDPDAGESFTYSLVSGEGSDDNAEFTIDGNKLKAASVFEFAEDGVYNIRVRVTDSDGNTFDKTFNIEITQGNVRLNSTNKVATIFLNRKLFENASTLTPARTLKDMIKISRNANDAEPTYEALGPTDTAVIRGSTVVVTFAQQITTPYNRIKIEAQAFKDLLGYKSAELTTTPLVIDTTGPTLNKVQLSRNKKSLELRFNEKILQTASAAALKAAITIDRGGTGVYSPLGSRDKVSIIKEYKIGRDVYRKLNRKVLLIFLNSRLTTLDNRIKINATALKDYAGNHSLEIITPEIEDITGPELSVVRLSPNNRTITVQFNEDAAFGSGSTTAERLLNLRNKLSFASDGETFNPLAATDTVALTNGNLVVTMTTALSGSTNKLRIGAEAVKDMFENQNEQLTTSNIVADATPPGCISLDESLCDSLSLPQIHENKRLQLVFNERVYKTATLKQAIQIKVGTAEYRALGSKDTVSTSGRRVFINFNRALVKDTTYQLRIAAGAMKDLTGNQNLALETVTFQVDTLGPKLR